MPQGQPAQDRATPSLVDATLSAMRLQHLNPADLPDWSKLFSQVVVAESGSMRIAVVSGQVGVDADQKIAGETLDVQFDRACRNLQSALRSAGLGTSDVAKLTIYIVDSSPECVEIITKRLSGHFGDRQRPALSLIGVQALARPEFLVEIEALAIGAAGSSKTRSTTKHPEDDDPQHDE